MKYSTREAAAKLGVTLLTLQKHVKKRTFAVPPLVKVGGVSVRLWTYPISLQTYTTGSIVSHLVRLPKSDHVSAPGTAAYRDPYMRRRELREQPKAPAQPILP
jgi:hypothetical protein